MKELIRNIATRLGQFLARFATRSRFGRVFLQSVGDGIRENVQVVSCRNTQLRLSSPTPLVRWRNESIPVKEPETLDWIDGLEEGSVLWDVGANVGLFSIYAAKSQGISVVSFEPSVFNLEIFARNIVLNNVVDKVVLVPLPLNDQSVVSTFELSTTEWGGALSTFQHGVTYSGEALRACFSYQTVGIALDSVLKIYSLPRPDYIKIDVDGIEHLVLKGGTEILKSVKSVLVEVDDRFIEQDYACREILSAAGMFMKEKTHSQLMESGKFSSLYNQIWVRT